MGGVAKALANSPTGSRLAMLLESLVSLCDNLGPTCEPPFVADLSKQQRVSWAAAPSHPRLTLTKSPGPSTPVSLPPDPPSASPSGIAFREAAFKKRYRLSPGPGPSPSPVAGASTARSGLDSPPWKSAAESSALPLWSRSRPQSASMTGCTQSSHDRGLVSARGVVRAPPASSVLEMANSRAPEHPSAAAVPRGVGNGQCAPRSLADGAFGASQAAHPSCPQGMRRKAGANAISALDNLQPARPLALLPSVVGPARQYM
jgi:hypothetical protein